MSGGWVLVPEKTSAKTRLRKGALMMGIWSTGVCPSKHHRFGEVHTHVPRPNIITPRRFNIQPRIIPRSPTYAASASGSPSPSFFAAPSSPSPASPFSASSFSRLSFSSSLRCLSAARILRFSSASALSLSFLARKRSTRPVSISKLRLDLIAPRDGKAGWGGGGEGEGGQLCVFHLHPTQLTTRHDRRTPFMLWWKPSRKCCLASVQLARACVERFLVL